MGDVEKAMPQRQGIAGFAAVVEGCVVERGGRVRVKLVGRGKIEDGMGWWSEGGWCEDGVGRCRRKGNV